jgi:hypothetical protein
MRPIEQKELVGRVIKKEALGNILDAFNLARPDLGEAWGLIAVATGLEAHISLSNSPVQILVESQKRLGEGDHDEN